MSANILVVEDDPAIRELVRLHLASANFEVRTAEDGAQGWQSVLKDPPDLIVSDIAMPNMDGFAFLAAVRKNEATASIPLIFLSAVDDRESFRRGMDLGADDFLNKPVRRNDLLSAISGRLKRLQGLKDAQRTGVTTAVAQSAGAAQGPRAAPAVGAPQRVPTVVGRVLAQAGGMRGAGTLSGSQPGQAVQASADARARSGAPKTPSSSVTQLMRAVQDDEARVRTASNVVKRSVIGTVLFSDIRGFTTYAEKLSAGETVELLNAYFSKACEPILDQNGWIVKFVGDGVIAMFDSPNGSNDHAERALKAGLLMVLAAHRFKRWILERFPKRDLPEFAIGVGVQTGEVMVCKMGVDKASETTIIGDTVNIASRLENKTKELAWSIVAGRESITLGGSRFRTRRSGQMVVKGRTEPVDIVEVIGLAPKTKASPTEQQFYDMIAQAVASNAAVTSASRKAALLEKSKVSRVTSALSSLGQTGRQDAPIDIEGYRLLRKLGEGGMSVVFLATHLESGAEQVLKILRLSAEDDGDILQRFIQEFALVSQIDHPNVARIFSQGFSHDHAYIAMEYFPGGDLRSMIDAGMTSDVCLAVVLQVASALGAIHERGIVHRDMKPDNVMIRADGTLALADFGIAKQLNSNMARTKHGEVFGTPYYLSPEQALGLQVDQRSDIYSLGVMFFEMLAGKKPYRGDNPQALLYQHVNAPLPQLPEPLMQFQSLINHLMAKKPVDRVQTADDIVNSVLAIINGESTTPFSLDF